MTSVGQVSLVRSISARTSSRPVLQRQSSLSVSNSTDLQGQIHDVQHRWKQLSKKWRRLPSCRTLEEAVSYIDVVFHPGKLGLQFKITSSNQVVLSNCDNPSNIEILTRNCSSLTQGLVIETINGNAPVHIQEELSSSNRPVTVRFRVRKNSVICRLCESEIETNHIEDHLRLCIMSSKSTANAKCYTDGLKKISKTIRTRLAEQSRMLDITHDDTFGLYTSLNEIAQKASLCSVDNIQAFDTCSQLLKRLIAVAEPLHAASITSLPAQRSYNYYVHIKRLIEGKMSAMRGLHKSQLQISAAEIANSPRREAPVALQVNAAPFYRSSSLGEVVTKQKRASMVHDVNISDFELIKPISKGAFGKIYLAKKKTTGDRYAIKILAKEHVLRKKQRSRIQTECSILANADSPFVVKLFWTFESNNNLFLVMEYLPGGDFMSLLDHSVRLDEDVARQYLAETVLALKYLHSIGCVHRDLKPDNLLITRDGHIKLTDFGLSDEGVGIQDVGEEATVVDVVDDLATVEEESVEDSAAVAPGTPDYFAPEIILGQPHGPPVDIWALGVLMYEMLVGIPPFNDETVEAIFSNILQLRIEWPDEGLSHEAVDLIQHLLLPSPEDRLTIQEIMEHPFFSKINWKTICSATPPFIPVLDDLDDTSYFNARDLTEMFIEGPIEIANQRNHVFRSFSFANMNALAEVARRDAKSDIEFEL